MEINFKKLMSNKSDDELQKYLDNRTKFVPEAIESAVAEMQKRGRVFSEEELDSYRNEFQAKREAAEKEKNEFFGNQWKKNVVTDENAPAYYSERAIYIFSILFSAIFGAVLLAINCRSTNEKKGVWEVIAFGVVYTGLQLWVLSMIPRSTGLTLVFSLAGALLMNHFFWKKYIGKNTKYRTKPIWKPLIIGLIISTLLLLAVIQGGFE
ncbi:hypothetical protein ABIB40_003158 [Pedobacter sp. UYP30]|uniref:hypothetical protein n=1 Tax=Pedobacter sp. UYP30 TaxID=1756400 RepID=UPI00339AB4D7